MDQQHMYYVISLQSEMKFTDKLDSKIFNN